MPLKRCTKDGKTGWKWGDSGHCYIGVNARKQALKQGIAIKMSQQRESSKSEVNTELERDIIEYYA